MNSFSQTPPPPVTLDELKRLKADAERRITEVLRREIDDLTRNAGVAPAGLDIRTLTVQRAGPTGRTINRLVVEHVAITMQL